MSPPDIELENTLLRQVIENATDSILLAEMTGRVIFVNRAVSRTFGYSPAEALTLAVGALFPADPTVRADGLHNALRQAMPWTGDTVGRRKDGALFPVQVALSFASGPPGRPAVAVLHARDVTEQQRLMDRLKQLSITDDLTGVYNARYLWARLRYEFLRARRYRQPLSCIMGDLDRFKAVNDTHGHRAGDEMLRLVAQTMEKVIRQADIAARYGGEEFAIILPNTGLDGALRCAEHIRTSIEQAVLTVGQDSLRVTISLGVAELAEDVSEEEALLRRADDALIRAKRAGRNRVCFWSNDMPPLAAAPPRA